MGVGFGHKLASCLPHVGADASTRGACADNHPHRDRLKGGVFAVLLRFFTQIDFRADDSLFWTFSVIAIASMLAR
jgi:hypothetical protein